ncbi:MAG: CoB--CoM heterodisulfide reductase iron-sulfur subunit B family protein [Promethearchaeota archaeon]
MSNKYFLGCVIPARFPFIEASTRKMFDSLGIEVSDIDGASCCPDPTGLEGLDHESWLLLGTRNISLFEQEGSDIISLCNGCTETLKWVQHELNEDEVKKREINKILKKIGKEYKGTAKIKHFAQVLHENLDLVKKKVTKPLEGFRVAVHYGCHYMRPSSIIQWDDPFEPHSLDEIVNGLGAESIDYNSKLGCCGNPVGKADEKLSFAMLKDKLDNINQTKTNCILVVCPACYQQFDFGQKTVNKEFGTDFSYPIFYLSELIGLSLGFSYDELGLKYHRNNVKPLLRSIGFMS